MKCYRHSFSYLCRRLRPETEHSSPHLMQFIQFPLHFTLHVNENEHSLVLSVYDYFLFLLYVDFARKVLC